MTVTMVSSSQTMSVELLKSQKEKQGSIYKLGLIKQIL